MNQRLVFIAATIVNESGTGEILSIGCITDDGLEETHILKSTTFDQLVLELESWLERFELDRITFVSETPCPQALFSLVFSKLIFTSKTWRGFTVEEIEEGDLAHLGDCGPSNTERDQRNNALEKAKTLRSSYKGFSKQSHIHPVWGPSWIYQK